MTIKVKIVYENDTQIFQDVVNYQIKDIPENNFIDIKYCINNSGNGLASAMIIYKE